MEIIKKITMFKKDMLCDRCGVGLMRPTGRIMLSSPPHYLHECPNCNNRRYYSVQYPYTSEKESE